MSGKKPSYGSGKQTLRLSANKPAEIEEVDNVRYRMSEMFCPSYSKENRRDGHINRPTEKETAQEKERGGQKYTNRDRKIDKET